VAIPAAGGKPVLNERSSSAMLIADDHVAGHVTKDIVAVNTRLENLYLTSSYLSGQNILGNIFCCHKTQIFKYQFLC
jgi:hypothetical protein